jgi:hypothetical protein
LSWVKISLKLAQVGLVGGRAGDWARMSPSGLNEANRENRYGVMKTITMISSTR